MLWYQLILQQMRVWETCRTGGGGAVRDDERADVSSFRWAESRKSPDCDVDETSCCRGVLQTLHDEEVFEEAQ